MDKKTIAAIIVVGIIVIASVYGNFLARISDISPTVPKEPSTTPEEQPTVPQEQPTVPQEPSHLNQSGRSMQTWPNIPFPHMEGPTSITVVDHTGTLVTITLPVRRIVCLTMLDMVYILGAGDKVVGRGYMTPEDMEISPLPTWLLEKPDVGTDWNPNMELILELNPDLVLASLRLSDVNRKKLEDAGIAVIEDTLMWPRRYDCIRNLGLILGAEAYARAQELIDYEMRYINLVKQRVEKLPRVAKPLVFFEWFRPWFSAGRNSTYEVMIVDAGGINIAENVTVVAPQLSAEWVAEKNPDIIIRMSTYLDGVDLAAFQRLWEDISERPEISETKAVKNGKVYIARDTILVGAQVIGLLQFAKWFHPNLFQDIDPHAVHQEMTRKFYGTELKGIYAYP